MKVITTKVVKRGGISYLRLPEELVFPEPTLQLEEVSPGKFLISRDPWIAFRDAAKMLSPNFMKHRRQPKQQERNWGKRTKKYRD